MSHSSDPDQPARRQTTVAVVLAVLLAFVGGVLSITPTTGTAIAWGDPPLELPVTAPDDAGRPVAAQPSATRRVIAVAAPDRSAPVAPRPPRTTAGQAFETTAGDAPPPGRSPPRH